MPTLNEQLRDIAITHQIGLLRLSARTAAQTVRVVNRVERDALAQVAAGGTGSASLEPMLELLRQTYLTGYAQATAEVESDVGDLAEYEADYQADVLERALPFSWDLRLPASYQVRAAALARPFQGRLLREWADQLGQAAYQRTRDAIRISFVEGENLDQIVRRIRGTRQADYKDGVTQISRRGAESLVRTAMNHTANFAREEVYAENDDLIDRVQWVSTLDLRTTPICRSRDGKTYPLKSGPRPPAHWGCRSTTVPVVKSWRELGVDLPEFGPGGRASVDGEVAADVTYETWLRGRSVAEQDDVLGPTRGRLFRSGGLTMDKFVDRTGHQYTLAELRRRDRQAFELAGL